MPLHVVEEEMSNLSTGGQRLAPMQEFMTSEGDRAARRRAIVDGLSLDEYAERPVGIRGERCRNRDFTRGTIAMGGDAIAGSVQAQIAVGGDQIEMQQVAQVRRLRPQELLCDRVCVLARSAFNLGVAFLRAKQPVPNLAVDVLTQSFELGRGEELADLSDTALSEDLRNLVNRSDVTRTGRCGGQFA